MAAQPPSNSDHKEIGQSVSLPVLDSKQSGPRSGAPMMGRTKIARWRAGVLILVNLLMIAHLIQWLITGSTISPIEPSEAMETLEVGVINAGAILFVLAFISTLLFGRFFCGWLCHMVALQDLCAYWMTKIGIRPKLFRSRLLVYFPFALGMYMFVWPTFKRLILAPMLKVSEIDWPAWLRPVEPISHYSTELIVEDFWVSMPPWHIAIVFLFICGFACVYFLGAKGFCTYGCPYAAFFKPMDKVAPVRVRVNDNCHQCGYCTSVCTSNVRVSEEVRDFGMVTDAGCMKTLDCISACPNDALSLGFGKVALGARPISPESYIQAQEKQSRRYDMTIGEELFASVVLLWFFFATRGLLDAVPMLMAGGLAAIGVMVVMTTIKMIRTANLRLYRYQLKAQGKLKPAGIVMILSAIGFIIGSAWSGQAKAMRWYGDVHYAGSDIPTSVLMRPDFQPNEAQRAQAKSAIWAYQRGDSIGRGGLGWSLNAEHRLRLSYFLGIQGNYQQSLDQLLMVIEEGTPTDHLVIQAGQLAMLAIDANPPEGLELGEIEQHKRQELLKIYEQALNTHPELHAIRTELSRSAYSVQDLEKAESYWKTTEFEEEASFYLAKAGYVGFTGNIEETRALYTKASTYAYHSEHPAGTLIDIGRSALQYRLFDIALEMAQHAIDHPSATALTWLAAGEIANATGDGAMGKARAEQALTMPGITRPMVQARAAGVLAHPGDTARARELLADAAKRANDPFEAMYIAQGMVRAGGTLSDLDMLNEGLRIYGEIAEANPDLYVITHDYASMLYSVGRADLATEQMALAAERDSTNVIYAQRASQLFEAIGNTEQQAYWEQEMLRRSQVSGP